MNGWCTFVLTEACVPGKEPVAKNRSTHTFKEKGLLRGFETLNPQDLEDYCVVTVK